jgi:hypothetical protein
VPSPSGAYPNSTPNGGYFHHVIDILGWRLSAITTTGNISTVSFLPTVATREDLTVSPWMAGNNPDPAKALAGIKIETGTLAKQFDLTQSYYEDASADKSGTSADKRLKLTSVVERSSDNSIIAKPYLFTYNEQAGTPTFLPNRLSSSVDHWGFYNGTANPHTGMNIPVTKLTPYVVGMETVYPIKGGSNRETNEASMRLGTISKVQYPTGGSTSFEMEANTFYGPKETYTYNDVAELKRPPGGDVCVNDVNPVQTVNFPAMTAAEIENLYYTWVNQAPPPFPMTCQQAAPNVVVHLHVNGANQPTYSATSNVSNVPGTVKSAEGKLKDLFKNNIPAGVPFSFKIQGINITSTLTFKKLTITTSTVNHLVGGLRVKKVTSNDGTAQGANVVKSYIYDKAVMPGQSSGILYSKPVYGSTFQGCLGGCTVKDWPDGFNVACPNQVNTLITHFFFETTVIPLASLEGYHIGYSAVREYFDAAASGYYNMYQYFNDPEIPFSGLPITPMQPRIGSGELESKTQRTANSTDIAYDTFERKPESTDVGLGTYIKWNTYRLGGEPNGNPIIFWKPYPITTKPFRYQSVMTFRDGQITTTTKQYTGSGHLQLTKEVLTNSDGKVTETEHKYPADLAASLPATQAAKLVELNMLVPLETTVKVSNVLLKGSKTEYAFFDNASGNFTGSTSAPALSSGPINFIIMK